MVCYGIGQRLVNKRERGPASQSEKGLQLDCAMSLGPYMWYHKNFDKGTSWDSDKGYLTDFCHGYRWDF